MSHLFFLRIAYVGTSFHGWQVQPVSRTVQGELWRALRVMEPAAPLPHGTGRTDAGVHAKAQGVLIEVSRPWDPYRLLAALNAHLPFEIRVMEVLPAPEGFFPRQHAVAKRYTYRINEGPAEDPFERNRRWHVFGTEPLDRRAMAAAAIHLLGEQDFSSFRHHDCVATTPIRHIYRVDLETRGSLLDIVFEGNRFLMHQVRIMAGTLVDVGKGRMSPESIPAVLEARNRRVAGQTAPPHGLCMERVWYQPQWGLGEPYS